MRVRAGHHCLPMSCPSSSVATSAVAGMRSWLVAWQAVVSRVKTILSVAILSVGVAIRSVAILSVAILSVAIVGLVAWKATTLRCAAPMNVRLFCAV